MARGRIGSWRAAALAVVVVLAGCAGDDDDAGSGSGSAPDTTAPPVAVTFGTLAPGASLPDCGVEAVDTPAGWAFALPATMVPTAFESDDIHYDVDGVTNDPATLLGDLAVTSFVGFDISEPSGDARSLTVGIAGAVGGGQATLADDDADGCWDVTIDTTFTELPVDDPDSTAPTTLPTVSTTPEEGAFALEFDTTVGIGTGQITTPRGTFALKLTRCDAGALNVEGVAAEGEITVTSVDAATFVVAWTYADGSTVVDDEAKVLGITADAATLVADGDGAEGPESLFVELACAFG